MGQPRTYRHWVADGDLVSFSATVEETDLYLRAGSNLEREAIEAIHSYRRALEDYIQGHPRFRDALEPLAVEQDAPPIVRDMAGAAERVGVGPMAAVAGAIAEGVGRELMPLSPEVIVENGGDIFLSIARPRVVGVYAGGSPFSGTVALRIEPEETPMGICTSSGTVGHSLSLGQADAVIAVAPSAALADAAATAIANAVGDAADIDEAIALAQGIDGLAGVVIIKDESMGVWGRIRLADPQEVRSEE